MSHSQFHCTGRVYLDLHGLIFETSICYWQDQPGSPSGGGSGAHARARSLARSGLLSPVDQGEALRTQVWTGARVRETVFAGRGPVALAGWANSGFAYPLCDEARRGMTTGTDRASRSRYRAIASGGGGKRGEDGARSENHHPLRPSRCNPRPALEASLRAGGADRPKAPAKVPGPAAAL